MTLECWDCDAPLALPDVGDRRDELRVDVPCGACGLVHTLAFDPEYYGADGQAVPWRVTGYITRRRSAARRGRR